MKTKEEVVALIGDAVAAAMSVPMAERTSSMVASVQRISRDLQGITPEMRGFRIVCDETNNTDADIQAGILNFHIYPPPARISINLTITKDGIQQA